MRWLAFLVLVLLFQESEALACSVCSNPNLAGPAEGDSTGTTLRHFRLGADVKVGSVRSGLESVDDRRGELSFSYAPISDLALSLAVPALYRTVHEPSLSKENALVMGDIELSATGTLWSSRGLTFQRLALTGGLKLPTAPLERDSLGRTLGSVLQPGCNSVTPNLGVMFALAKGLWAFDFGVSFYMPIAVRKAPHTGDSIRTHVGLELRPNRFVAGRTGLTTRFEPTGELYPSVSDPNSGGLIVSTVTELRVMPTDRLSISAGVYSPVAQFLRGRQHLSNTFSSGITASF